MLRRSLPFLILSLCTFGVRAQSIVTYVGGGTMDGQRVANIVTGSPRGLTFDRAGNLYMALDAGFVLRVEKGTTLVTRVAGTGASGYGGDGDIAVNAALNHPIGLALDGDDNLFIADTDNELVRRVDAKTGIITTFAGGGTPLSGNGDGGTATNATLSAPFGLAINNGFLYVSESGEGGNRVRRVDMTTETIDTFAGSTTNPNGAFSGDGGPAKQAQLDTPAGLAFDTEGNLYIADYGNTRVRRVDTNGIITTYAGGGSVLRDGIPATSAEIGSVTVLAFDAGGNLCVFADPVIKRIDKATGLIGTLSNQGGFLYGLAFDASGTLYFSDDDSRSVYTQALGSTNDVVFAGEGQFIRDGHLPAAAILHQPQGIAFDAYGNLYVADALNSVVREVTPSGTIVTVAGIPGQPDAGPQEGRRATDAQIGYPNDIAIDSRNNLYISDRWNGRVWHVDTHGILRTYAGGGDPDDGFGDGGPAADAVIAPNAIMLDDYGNLFIADDDLNAIPPRAVIRMVDTNRFISTVVGSYTPGYSGDGGYAWDAQLSRPSGLALASDGGLFISDYGNGALRRVGRDGRITSISTFKDDGLPLGDEGPVGSARLRPAHIFIDRKTEYLYMADMASNRIRVIDAKGIIHTVAGSGLGGDQIAFSGDNGPATAAKLSLADGDFSGVFVSPAGDVFFSDSQNNRIRAVFACAGSMGTPQLTSPADNTANAPSAPQLSWSAASGASHYDVLIDTNNPPVTKVAADVNGLSFTPANLKTGTKYYWQIVAKADPNCPARGPSAVWSFTTAATPPRRHIALH
jgi:sugar lactone lactonase YvrE